MYLHLGCERNAFVTCLYFAGLRARDTAARDARVIRVCYGSRRAPGKRRGDGRADVGRGRSLCTAVARLSLPSHLRSGAYHLLSPRRGIHKPDMLTSESVPASLPRYELPALRQATLRTALRSAVRATRRAFLPLLDAWTLLPVWHCSLLVPLRRPRSSHFGRARDAWRLRHPASLLATRAVHTEWPLAGTSPGSTFVPPPGRLTFTD